MPIRRRLLVVVTSIATVASLLVSVSARAGAPASIASASKNSGQPLIYGKPSNSVISPSRQRVDLRPSATALGVTSQAVALGAGSIDPL